jgi:hypothetical protein
VAGADGSTFTLPLDCACTTICVRTSSDVRHRGEDSRITIERHRERHRNIEGCNPE